MRTGENMISYDDFRKVDMRVGKIISVEDFPEARNPSYKLKIDFGPELGIKKSCAQITQYSKEELMGRLVVCTVNFPPKQIANATSEVLTMGAENAEGKIVLLAMEREVPLGKRIY